MRLKTQAFLLSLIVTNVTCVYAQRIATNQLQYCGVFRLPGPSGGSDWMYSGQGLTCYPQGDAQGPDDGYPGSLFMVGHDHQQYVAELSIPVPLISRHKILDDLNTAETLQPFADITGGLFGEMEMAVTGIACLPAQGDGNDTPLYFCRGQHIQYGEASHGRAHIDLSDPRPQGTWHLSNYCNYTTNDMLFEIPKGWADRYAPGQTLATGRFREGLWSGLGPALFACAPWLDGDPPPPDAVLTAVTPLLLYGEDDPGIPEIITDPSRQMTGYREADQWTGGAWLQANETGAVIIAGTKAMGSSWYGFSDGTVWPYEGPYPPVPTPPHDERGYWADSIHAQILFYDPDDLGRVALGQSPHWTPQPYAVLDITDRLFDAGYHFSRGKRQSLGACAFDSEHGLLYVVERRADQEKSLIHVWRLNTVSTACRTEKPAAGFALSLNFPNPFNPTTQLWLDVPETAEVTVTVFNLRGQQLQRLHQGQTMAGRHPLTIDASDWPSGLYFCRLEAPGMTQTLKMLLQK